MWYETYLYGKKLKNCTKNWNEDELVEDAVLLKNTYLNAVGGVFGMKEEVIPVMKKKKGKRCVVFDNVVSVIDSDQTLMLNAQ